MQDRIMNPVGVEESLLVIRLSNQGISFYEAELRLTEKMKPAKLAPLSPVAGNEPN